MRFEQALAELSPLQREIVRSLLRGEDQAGDEVLALRHSMSAEAVRAERFLACERLRQALDRDRHSEP